jgi:hypothetical protein
MSYFSFGISDRASARFSLPGDLLLLGLEGNEQFLGKSAEFSRLRGEMNYFRQYAFGYSRDINRWFDIGGRVKVLFGKANLSFTGTEMSLYTDPESYDLRLRSKFNMHFSMPLTLIQDEQGKIDDIESHFNSDSYSLGNFLFSSRNAGLAADLGITFRVSRQMTLHTSITDLGFIRWGKDAYNLQMDSNFDYGGLDMTPVLDYRDDSVPVENLVDSLKGMIRTSEGAYTRSLPARVYFGGTYALKNGMSLGLLSRTGISRYNVEQIVTLSASSDINEWLSATVTYSLMNSHYNNLGLGLSARRGIWNLYMVSDNIASTIVPQQKRNVNFWLGLNLVFGQGASER